MRDRFTRGVLSGLEGAVGKDLVDAASHFILHYGKATFWEWNAILILGRPPGRILDWLIAQVGELILAVLLGLVFVYLVSHVVSSRRLLFKSTMYGLGAWYFLYAIPKLFRIPGLFNVATQTAVTHVFSTLTFGFCLGWALRYLNRKDEHFEGR